MEQSSQQNETAFNEAAQNMDQESS